MLLSKQVTAQNAAEIVDIESGGVTSRDKSEEESQPKSRSWFRRRSMSQEDVKEQDEEIQQPEPQSDDGSSEAEVQLPLKKSASESKKSRSSGFIFSPSQKTLDTDLEEKEQTHSSGPLDPPTPHPSQRHQSSEDSEEERRYSRRTLGLFLVLFILLGALVGVGSAYLGAELAFNEDDDTKDVPVPEPAPPLSMPTESPPGTDVPTVPPIDPAAACVRDNEALLKLEILFDSKPEEVGISLSDDGQGGGAAIWLFEPDTFQSFTHFQRLNVFSICLVATTTITFEVTDTGLDGLVSPLSFVYGSWKLSYGSEVIVEYNGDCGALENVGSSTLTACGEYCSCSYTVSADSLVGGCETVCDGVSVNP